MRQKMCLETNHVITGQEPVQVKCRRGMIYVSFYLSLFPCKVALFPIFLDRRVRMCAHTAATSLQCFI